ncbi:hypothetical protein KY290_036824 [Solanum tuberosum]|uniref:Retroviral polymerase SH3-like domain-containing protein n=1 Tax=Solanum tuberosum TaxID=4113 RepID=A0ABQ7TV42_SOLTU|nr:hypothetical protein KY285_036146 [Solanum tuberosum]KAH0738119.1 hypothetical protein KY290_036824 [Solanum tuberosum]
MREEDNENDSVDQSMAFQAQKTQGNFGRGRGNSFRGWGQGRARGQFGPKYNNDTSKGSNTNKFQPKTFPCVFIGYSSLHKGYRCYNP